MSSLNPHRLLKAAVYCGLMALSPQLIAAQESSKPNIILIMADDLGYECIGANGSDDYKTPVIDTLASNGVRFNNCFGNPLCTPSRVKIMTGMYNVRNYVKFAVLDRSQKTFAHVFKEAGYATCIAGKWQLGTEQDAPQHFGFDQSCLWQHTRISKRKNWTNDTRYSNPRFEINGALKDYNNGEYGPDVCADFICDFIEENKDQPFLAYYPMILPHCPFTPPPGTKDWDPSSPGSDTYKGDAKYFPDMVHHIDKIVGKILTKLDEHGLRENTLVIFTGDNGTDKPIVTSLNGEQVAGNKGQMSDNGTRVPLIVSYPGKTQEGLVSDELVDFADILPTMCEATGVAIPNDRPLDGVSFWSTLQGKNDRKKPWVYIWYNKKVLARTNTHMVRRIKPNGPIEFLDYSKPYKENHIGTETLDDDQKTTYETLLGVIKDFDKVRPK